MPGLKPRPPKEAAQPFCFLYGTIPIQKRIRKKAHLCRLVRCNSGVYWESAACAAEKVADFGRSEGKCEPAQPSIP